MLCTEDSGERGSGEVEEGEVMRWTAQCRFILSCIQVRLGFLGKLVFRYSPEFLGFNYSRA